MGFRAPIPATQEEFDLCSPEYAKSIIGSFEATDDNADDDLIDELIHGCSRAMVNSICYHNFKYGQYTFYESGDGSDTIMLPDWPVDLDAEFKLWIGRDSDGTFPDADYLKTRWADYVVDANTGIVTVYGSFPEGLHNIKCTHYGGYKAGKVPHDLQLGTALWIAAIFSMPNDRRHGVVSKTREGYTLNLDMQPIPEKALKFVDKYINPASG